MSGTIECSTHCPTPEEEWIMASSHEENEWYSINTEDCLNPIQCISDSSIDTHSISRNKDNTTSSPNVADYLSELNKLNAHNNIIIPEIHTPISNNTISKSHDDIVIHNLGSIKQNLVNCLICRCY